MDEQDPNDLSRRPSLKVLYSFNGSVNGEPIPSLTGIEGSIPAESINESNKLTEFPNEPAVYSSPKPRRPDSQAGLSEVNLSPLSSRELLQSGIGMQDALPLADEAVEEEGEELVAELPRIPRDRRPATASIVRHRGSSNLSGYGDMDFLEAFSATRSVVGRQSIIVDYWRQIAAVEDAKASKQIIGGSRMVHPSAPHRMTFSRAQIDGYIREITKEREVEKKEKIQEEVRFIQRHFKQRHCKNYCKRSYEFKEKFMNALRRKNIKIQGKLEMCCCGLTMRYHRKEALDNAVKQWNWTSNTEAVHPWNFGNVDITGHYSYLDLPQGTRKYIRLDDTRQPTAIHLYQLLTRHWGLRKPNMVLSITGGDILPMLQNKKLHSNFRDGVMKTVVNTKAWILTEGLYHGSSREIGDIFQEDLKRSEWSEVDNHADIPLIAMAPWGIVAAQEELMGIYVGSREAKYNFNSINSSEGAGVNALDPYHTVYVLADDGTHGHYSREPRIRGALERHIKMSTTIEMMGAKEVATPVVILVVGGDRFTLEKVADATAEDVDIPVVIVDGSGAVATMLADTYKAMRLERSTSRKAEFTTQEEATLTNLIEQFKEDGLLGGRDDEQHLREIMLNTHLITVFGVSENDERNLDTAILNATFGAIKDISAQLNLTLAMNRVDVAKEYVFIEARKDELNEKNMIHDALFVALRSTKSQFVQLLIDQDLSAELNFNSFLTMNVLLTLYRKLLDPSQVLGKVLISITKKDVYGTDELSDSNLLPQIGRILHYLLGNNYRLLYQEMNFREYVASENAVVNQTGAEWSLCKEPQEEAVWHIFLWAVLSNHREIAEHFIFETSCKIGAALVACKLLKSIAKVAEVWHEAELVNDLNKNAEYFENLALQTIDNMYEMNREDAYASLVAVLPFRFGQNLTPLSMADDAECMKFMGHACCQTLLNLIWMQYMDLDTSPWKLVPVFSLFPFINLPLITFDEDNLSFGMYKREVEESGWKVEAVEQGAVEGAKPARSGSTRRLSVVSEHDNLSLHSQTSMTDKKQSAKIRLQKRLKFAWFCLKNYYTAPVNKFAHGLVTYVIFLALFSHMVLSELKPVKSASDVPFLEWLLYVWVGCIALQELQQLISRKSSGPLHKLNWVENCEPAWRQTWHLHERMFFVTRLHRVQLWLSDRWNKIDALMILLFAACVVLRFTLADIDFVLVRFFFSITLILFYLRLLRLGYILKALGPRIITIRAMVADLIQFFIILSVFLISFGIAFQCILEPNEKPSWNLLVDILWRPYWQMYGELFIGEDGLGREVNTRGCYNNRTRANEEDGELCYDWLATVLLAVFMLITNIMLLNLLIAIFSHSFEKIESESQLIWKYHMYDLVHEYYESTWLPPPLNIFCLLAIAILWILSWPRRWAYLDAKRRCRNRVHAEKSKAHGVLFETERDNARLKKIIEQEIEEGLQKDIMYRMGLYYTDKMLELSHISHFRQEEFMRNEDMEEKAYKRYRRQMQKQKDKEHKVKDLLKLQSVRLQNITSDLAEVKQQTSIMQKDMIDTSSQPGNGITPQSSTLQYGASHNAKGVDDMTVLKHGMQALTQKVEYLQESMMPILNFIQDKSDRKKDRKSRRVESVRRQDLSDI